MTKTIKKNGTRKAPPPFLNTKYGNLQTFPKPTAYPIHANINSIGFDQLPRPAAGLFIAVVDDDDDDADNSVPKLTDSSEPF